MSEHFTIITDRLDLHNDNIEIILEIKNGKYILHDDGNTLVSLAHNGFDVEEIEEAINKTMKRISYDERIIFMPTNFVTLWPDFRFMLEEITKLFARFVNKKIGENNAKFN